MLSSWYVTVHSTVITKTICTTVAHGPMWPVQRSIQLESKNCSCWRRKWQSTPVFLPGESHGQRSLAGCSAWGRKEADMTDRLTLSLYFFNTIKCTHIPTSSIFSPCKTETTSHFPSLQSLTITILFFPSVTRATVVTSYKWNQTVVVCFCDWLILLNIMSSRLIHIIICKKKKKLLLLQFPDLSNEDNLVYQLQRNNKIKALKALEKHLQMLT